MKPAVKIFSRHLEDMTDKASAWPCGLWFTASFNFFSSDFQTQYPDVVSLVEDLFENSAQTQSFIMDAEVVAIDPSTGALKTFQELSNRARKDVKLDEVKVAVCAFAFDLMYLDGQVGAGLVRRFPCLGKLTCDIDTFGEIIPRAPRATSFPLSSVYTLSEWSSQV